QLAELQKQIISATWKLQRLHSSPRSEPAPKPSRNKSKVWRAVPSAPRNAGFQPAVSQGFQPASLSASSGASDSPGQNVALLKITDREPSPARSTFDGEGSGKVSVAVSRSRLLRAGDGSRSVQNIFAQLAPDDSYAAAPITITRSNLAKISTTNKTSSASQFVTDLGVVRDAVA